MENRIYNLINCQEVLEYINNLEQQLAEKDNEIDNLKELRKFEIEDKKELRENRLQEIIKLEKKLVEKDKEIEELKTSIDYWKNEVFKKIEVKLTGVTKEKIQEIRKQVCDKVRERIENGFEYDCEYTYERLVEVLDQIEKGEEV